MAGSCPGPSVEGMHTLSAREETDRQIARCLALHKRFDEQRRTLERESAKQSAAIHRLSARIEEGQLGVPPRLLLDRRVDEDRRLAGARR
jgi:hypothetical protein